MFRNAHLGSGRSLGSHTASARSLSDEPVATLTVTMSVEAWNLLWDVADDDMRSAFLAADDHADSKALPFGFSL